MSTRIYDGSPYAYCRKYDEDRQIAIKIVETSFIGGEKSYTPTRFECTEYKQGTCKYVDKFRRCPFIYEVSALFARG